MPRLAIAIGEGARLGFDEAELPVDARAGEAALKGRREPVLLYRPEPGFNLFIATGRVAGMEFSADGQARLCRIAQMQAFPTPVLSDREAALPRRLHHLQLSDERFAELLAEGIDTGAARLAAEEMGAAFEAGPQDRTGVYRRVYESVLRRWDFHCAMTGTSFAATDGVHPFLEVVAIRPRELGGPLHVDNFLPMVPAAAAAWTHGHMTLGPDLAFWVDKSRIDPELEEMLRPIGRLLEPAPAAGGPDLSHIGFHRSRVFAAR